MTFESVELASHAQTALDGCEEGWKITFARRPPQPGSWTPAQTPRSTQPPKDPKRSLLAYDDMSLFD